MLYINKPFGSQKIIDVARFTPVRTHLGDKTPSNRGKRSKTTVKLLARSNKHVSWADKARIARSTARASGFQVGALVSYVSYANRATAKCMDCPDLHNFDVVGFYAGDELLKGMIAILFKTDTFVLNSYFGTVGGTYKVDGQKTVFAPDIPDQYPKCIGSLPNVAGFF